MNLPTKLQVGSDRGTSCYGIAAQIEEENDAEVTLAS
jgi:hypothetical protein